MENKPDIKIFVSHRIDLDSETIDNPLYVNVRCGAVFDKRKNITMLGDDTGDNISEKRKSLCELTVMYWAWKNVDADYYGLCHYRRYFSFSDEKYEEDEYSFLREPYITNDVVHRYELDNCEKVHNLMKKYDCIVTTPFNVRNVGAKNLREQYASQEYLDVKDFDVMLEVISDIYPEYLASAKKYLYGDKLIPCCMFIMKKDMFFSYAQWLFNIIEELEKRIDLSSYTEEGYRTIAHLAERLLGVFIEQKRNNFSISYVQRIIFDNTNRIIDLYPVSKKAIPVVFASSDYYIPYLYITIVSMCNHISVHSIYEIIILHTNIRKKNKTILCNLMKIYENIVIKFYDVSKYVFGCKFIANNHVSVETFYRLYIPEIFANYEKVIYLDSDLIIQADVSELMNLSSDHTIITATKDFDYESQYRGNKEIENYTHDVLKMENVEKYFQAGVMLFNIKNYKKKYNDHDMVNFATTREFIYVDQDVMNSMLKGDIEFISNNWNVMTDCAGTRMENIKRYASMTSYGKYLESRQNPKIIHYAGWAKPWERPEDDFADKFWDVARTTPYYEVILSRLANTYAWGVYNYKKRNNLINILFKIFMPNDKNKKLKMKCMANKILSRFAPIGSKRRKFLKNKYNTWRTR